MTAGSRPLLLVVDDETGVLSLIRRVAEGEGFEVITCTDGRQALQIAHQRRPDLVMVDLRMPDVAGLEIVRALRAADAKAMIVLMTGYGSIDSAVEAVKLGAADYLTKPFDLQRLKHTFGTVREETERRARMMAVDREVAERLEFAGMIGRSPAMQEVFDLIRRLAPHVRTALVSGETGTGKELVARALHHYGPRRARRFVAVNCSAVVETLFESELFGHVRGAFTGATDTKAGLFEAADGGTLFLDEISELPMSLQAKLVRVLETGEVQRVGSLQPVKTDVRVVCATNRDLGTEAMAGNFRSDLLYRLNVVHIALPALRDRREDIPYLTAAFVREFSDRFSKPISGVALPAERLLNDAAWPGNIRQLRNVIERACMLTDGPTITPEDIQASIRPAIVVQAGASTRREVCEPASRLSSLERHHIMKVIAETGGNKARAARQLGLSRRALYRRLERHGLAEPAAVRARQRVSTPTGV
jgi:two-component system, NtrC family, response regulator AtoC